MVVLCFPPGKITYEFRQPFGSGEMFQFFLGSQLFRETIIVAPLSRQVYGIGGQTNTLSDPPLHEANGVGTGAFIDGKRLNEGAIGQGSNIFYPTGQPSGS